MGERGELPGLEGAELVICTDGLVVDEFVTESPPAGDPTGDAKVGVTGRDKDAEAEAEEEVVCAARGERGDLGAAAEVSRVNGGRAVSEPSKIDRGVSKVGAMVSATVETTMRVSGCGSIPRRKVSLLRSRFSSLS